MHFWAKLALLLILGVSLAANVGNITALNGSVSIERGGQALSAVLGASIETKDTVSTAKNSKAQLTFKDHTIVTVGKESRFSVEEYLFDATPASGAKFNMITGTIRAMSGKIGKIAPEKFIVKTKTATIGIRGTDFIIHVSLSNEITIWCLEGSIIVRSTDTQKSVIVPAGSFVTLLANGVMGEVREFSAEELNSMLNEGFLLSNTGVVPKRGIIHPDESFDRGAVVDVESAISDIGGMMQMPSVPPSVDENPQIDPTQDGISPTTGMP